MFGRRETYLSTLLIISILAIQPLIVSTSAMQNIQINYRGIATISTNELKFLWGLETSNVRFALWNGTKWIELPFWLKDMNVDTIKQIDLNFTFKYMAPESLGGTIEPKRISSDKVFIIVLPKSIGIKANSTNWWKFAKDTKLNLRNLIILKTNITGGLIVKNYIYVYYGYKASALPANYKLRFVYFNFDEPKKELMIANNTDSLKKIERESHIKVDFKKLKEKFPRLYDFAGIGECEEMPNDNRDYAHALDDDSPGVFVHKNVMYYRKFRKTGRNFVKSDPFTLPWQIMMLTSVYVRVTSIPQGDTYYRLFYIAVNGEDEQHIIYSDTWLEPEPFDTGYIEIPTSLLYFARHAIGNPNMEELDDNFIYVELTTYVGYWSINVTIYFRYEAYEHYRPYVVNLANPEYTFSHTGWNIIRFPLSVPEQLVYNTFEAPPGIVPESIGTQSYYYDTNVKFVFHLIKDGDTCGRVFRVYIDSDLIYSATIYRTTTISFNITPTYFMGKRWVTVGVIITTYVGKWHLSAEVYMVSRYIEFSDDAHNWNCGQWNIPSIIHYGNIIASLSSDGYTSIIGHYTLKIDYDADDKRLLTYLTVSYQSASEEINYYNDMVTEILGFYKLNDAEATVGEPTADLHEHLAYVGNSEIKKYAFTAIRLFIAALNAFATLNNWGKMIKVLTTFVGVGTSILSESGESPSAYLSKPDYNAISITYENIPCLTSEEEGKVLFYDLYSVNLKPDINSDDNVLKVVYSVSLNVIARVWDGQYYTDVPLGMYTFGYWTYYYRG
ncbi:MAG: hypothetical protein J7L07_05095 [Candidatus Odinarchaeota archaeon]|nr:hypothetical protein [Candidatus Odinarchaeota archaeon]